MAERSKAVVCRTIAFGLRRFESCPAHIGLGSFFACYNSLMFRVERSRIIGISVAIAVLLPAITVAASLPGTIVPCNGISCTCGDLVQLAQNVLNTGIYFAVFISAVLFAWAGWQMISGKSLGESGKIEEAKKVLWNVMIGLVIILAAWLIVDTIMRSLTTLPVWNSICPRS